MKDEQRSLLQSQVPIELLINSLAPICRTNPYLFKEGKSVRNIAACYFDNRLCERQPRATASSLQHIRGRRGLTQPLCQLVHSCIRRKCSLPSARPWCQPARQNNHHCRRMNSYLERKRQASVNTLQRTGCVMSTSPHDSASDKEKLLLCSHHSGTGLCPLHCRRVRPGSAVAPGAGKRKLTIFTHRTPSFLQI